MNFRKNARVEPVVNMTELAAKVDDDWEARSHQGSDAHIAYAPPAIRDGIPGDEPAVRHIATFGEMPTKEIDEIIAAAKAEVAELERTAQLVRNMYVKCTDRITADVKRLREGVRLGMETMNTLREQCLKLNVEAIVEEAKKED
jgi:hypothetical protein